MLFNIFAVYLFLANQNALLADQGTISAVDTEKYSIAKERRYLFYEVNPGEGMSLRRDVYMRVAQVLRHLREHGDNFILVLPPWGASIHWQSAELGFQEKIPWKLWFDLDSLNHYIPVIELDDFIQGWTKWEDKYEFRPCIKHYYYEETPGHWRFWFWGYDEIYAKNVTCVSFQGQSKHAADLITSTLPDHIRSIMLDRSEVMLHDFYGGKPFWDCRRSMRYSAKLRQIADQFRSTALSSNDDSDQTTLTEDWRKMRVNAGQALGGPYLAMHLRRRDFVTNNRSHTPSIDGAVKRVVEKCKELNLTTVYVATDGNKNEVSNLFDGLRLSGLKPVRFVPNREVLHKYLDGGVAIIEQWICAHARYFIGSGESTYTLRIFEDREILGFHSSTTHNSFCGDDQPDCEQPGKWLLVQ